LTYASNNALLVGLVVQNAALSRKLRLKQPKRCVLFLHSQMFSQVRTLRTNQAKISLKERNTSGTN